MRAMTGGQGVVQTLLAQGVNTVFSLPGAHTLSIYDALVDTPAIQHVTVRHEQGAAFMADGYARASGRVGVAITTTGPALANAAAALGEAWADSIPVLLIASHVPSTILGKGKGWVHEGRDQSGMAEAIARHHYLVREARAIPETVAGAYRQAAAGRPGPAIVEIPHDLLSELSDLSIPPAVPLPRARAAPSPESIASAATALADARQAIIWSGGGVISSGAWEELREIAELLQAPVVSTSMGLGAIPADHPLFLGTPSGERETSRVLAEADALLAVGSRFAALTTRNWKLALPRRIVHIDLDPVEIGKNYPVEVAVVGDARESLRALLAELRSRQDMQPRKDATDLVRQFRAALREHLTGSSVSELRTVEGIREAVGRSGIVAFDVAIVSEWARRYFPVYEPRTFMAAPGYSCMGFALPAAIGARAARPDRPVVAVAGDGGFMMTCAEMATAAQHGLKVVAVVFNNDSYGMIKEMQRDRYGPRHVGVELANPDFVKLAEAFGWRALRLKDTKDLKSALDTALAFQEPALIEVQAALARPS